MQCDDVRLDAYFDQELPSVEAQAVEQHLGDCAQCRRLLTKLALMRDVLRKSVDESLSPIALARAHRVADEYVSDSIAESSDTTLMRLALQFTGLAASILIVACAWSMTSTSDAVRRTSHPARPVSVAAVPTLEWERVATTLRIDANPDPSAGGDPHQALADASTRDAQLADWVIRGLTR